MSSDDRLILVTGPSPRGAHRIGLAGLCLQRFAWTYPTDAIPKGDMERLTRAQDALEGLKDGGSDATDIGSLIHLWLAHRYQRMMRESQGEDPDLYYEPEEAVRIYAEAQQWEHHLPRVLTTMHAYEAHWSSEILKVIGVEKLAETYVDGHWITGRWDLVVEDRQGLVWIWDHKSTSRFGHGLVDKYSKSLQFLVYSHMGRELYGDRFAGMRINFIQHAPDASAVRFERKTATPAPHRQRTLPQTISFWETIISALRDSRDIDDWPKANSRGACYAYGQECPFMERCDWGT